jgi:M6 family metalloprotease-like protein
VLLTLLSLEVVSLVFAQPQGVNPAGAPPGHVRGVYSLNVILVEFSDVKHSVGREEILEKLQGLARYVEECSYGMYKLEFYVTERWYTLRNSMEFYDKDLWSLLKDSIEASDGEVKFSPQAKVVIVHAGGNEAFTKVEKDIRSQYFNVGCGSPIRTNDGTLISSAIIVSEFDPLGAIAHEFLHMLGAFDLYGGEGERERFVGDWDIMATGHRLGVELIGNKLIGGKSPSHPSSWTKIRIGWFRDSDFAVLGPGRHKVELLPLESPSEGLHVIKVPITHSKYYLIEVREKIGFDSYLPDEGFLVYICNDTATSVFNGLISVVDSNPGTKALDPFKPGQKLISRDGNIVIEFSKSDRKYIVKVDYRAPNVVVKPLPPSESDDKILLQADVENSGNISANRVEVTLFVNGVVLRKLNFDEIPAGGRVRVSALLPREPGNYTVLWEAQVVEDVLEYSEDDNRVLMYFRVAGERGRGLQKWGSAPLPCGYARILLEVGDLDGDSVDEVVYYERALDILSHNGSLIEERDGSLISVIDIDGDGVKEVFYSSRLIHNGALFEENMLCLQSFKTNGLNWRVKSFFQICWNSVRFADVNNDGVMDILILHPLDRKEIKSKYGSNLNVYGSLNICIISGKNGELLGNFTVTTKEEETFEYWYYCWVCSGSYGLVTVEDIDADSKPEIVVGLFYNDISEGWYNIRAYVIYVYSVEGRLIWRKELPASCDGWCLKIGNFIGDSRKEFLIVGYCIRNGIRLLDWMGNTLWSLDVTGGRLPGGNIVTSRGEIVIPLWSEIILVDPATGSIKASFRVNGEEVNMVTLGVVPSMHRILFSTDKAFYLLDEEGRLVSRKFFGTYSWPTFDAKGNLLIQVYKSKTVYKGDMRNGSIHELFTALTEPSTIKLANLDADRDPEYVVLGSFIEARDTDGSLMWTFGLGSGVEYGTPLDLDNDGVHDAVFVKCDFMQSFLYFRSGRLVYGLENCEADDLNGDGFKEVVCVSDRGLEIYDVHGNLVWSVVGADFRGVSIGRTQYGKKMIAVSVGIFAKHMDMPPQVRIYSDTGKLIKVIGFYWDPPYVQILESKITGKSYILVIGPWGRGEDHLEFYTSDGNLIFDRIVSEDVWRKCYDYGYRAKLQDVNGDGKEEIVLEPYVFSLDGELLTNEYKSAAEPENVILSSDIDSDGVVEVVKLPPWPWRSVNILSGGKTYTISLEEFGKISGKIVAVKSGDRELTLFIPTLTLSGYRLVPLRCYHVKIVSPYGNAQISGAPQPGDSGWYKEGQEITIKAEPVIPPETGFGGISEIKRFRRVFVSWGGDFSSTSPTATVKVDSPKRIVANWKTQYLLTVISNYGNPQGGGWYDEGSRAVVKLRETEVYTAPLIRYVFDHWEGLEPGDRVVEPGVVEVSVDKPRELKAVWRADYSQFVVLLVACAIAAGSSLAYLRRKRKAQRS